MHRAPHRGNIKRAALAAGIGARNMEYLGLAGAWKTFEGFAISEPMVTVLIVLGVAVVLVLAFNWLAKR